jgi:hypothetical protein
MAPSSARVRTPSSGKAVMKINGTRSPLSRMTAMSSGPLMSGICTSAITHDVSFNWADCKNSPADANVRAVYLCDLRRFSVAVRTDASSSMMDITEAVVKADPSEVGTESLPGNGCPRENSSQIKR